MWMLLIIVPILMMIMAQTIVTSAFYKYRSLESLKKYTGEMVAHILLERNDLIEVDVKPTEMGLFSEHYDTRLKTVHLSNEVYYGNSIMSIAIAAHECSHVIQDKEGKALSIRNTLLPFMQAGAQIGWISLLVGIIFFSRKMIEYSVIIIMIAAWFQILTLPIENKANRIALQQLVKNNIIDDVEENDIANMLRATMFIYVASLISLVTLIIKLISVAVKKHKEFNN